MGDGEVSYGILGFKAMKCHSGLSEQRLTLRARCLIIPFQVAGKFI